jgi:peptidyl-prolyl cis-trans isomerase SurA
MNLGDDYSKISQASLEQKKAEALDKWIKAKMPTYYIMVNDESKVECPKMNLYASTDAKGF